MVLQCSTYNYNVTDDNFCAGPYDKCARDIYCPPDQDNHCFAVFRKSPNSTNGLTIVSAGCNERFDLEHCANECVGTPRARDLFYCCCNNQTCNRNPIFPRQAPATIDVTTPTPPVQRDSFPDYVILIAALVVTTIVIATFIKKRPAMLKRGPRRRRTADGNEHEESNNRLMMNHGAASEHRSGATTVAGQRNGNNVVDSGEGGAGASELADLRSQLTVTIFLPTRKPNHQAADQPNHNNTNHIHIEMNQTMNNAARTNQHDARSSEQNQQSYTRIDLKDIKLLEIIGSGRFGTVHKATVASETPLTVATTTLTTNSTQQQQANGALPTEPTPPNELHEYLKEFAIKVIPSTEYPSWQNEVKIYSSSRTRHSNILNFLGSCQHVESNCYWLFVEYASKGSLHHYLKHNTISWNEFLSISLGIVHGLSHLHDADVAHRDFKSKNVLLKHDLTPCITDFGVAALLDISGGSQTEQRKKYLQVGTPRYMAPEVLECSVTFTKISFTKIDVYALSLVLWELISRCYPLPGTSPQASDQPAPYCMPFENVVGPNPDINTMRQVVINEKLRPPIRPDWLNYYPVYKFCQAIIDGWEYDHDARISASCFVERIEAIQQQLQHQQQQGQQQEHSDHSEVIVSSSVQAGAVVHSTA